MTGLSRKRRERCDSRWLALYVAWYEILLNNPSILQILSRSQSFPCVILSNLSWTGWETFSIVLLSLSIVFWLISSIYLQRRASAKFDFNEWKNRVSRFPTRLQIIIKKITPFPSNTHVMFLPSCLNWWFCFVCTQFNKWLRDSKSRVLDIFRRMDHDRDGKLTREQFITGVLNTSKRDIMF